MCEPLAITAVKESQCEPTGHWLSAQHTMSARLQPPPLALQDLQVPADGPSYTQALLHPQSKVRPGKVHSLGITAASCAGDCQASPLAAVASGPAPVPLAEAETRPAGQHTSRSVVDPACSSEQPAEMAASRAAAVAQSNLFGLPMAVQSGSTLLCAAQGIAAEPAAAAAAARDARPGQPRADCACAHAAGGLPPPCGPDPARGGSVPTSRVNSSHTAMVPRAVAAVNAAQFCQLTPTSPTVSRHCPTAPLCAD